MSKLIFKKHLSLISKVLVTITLITSIFVLVACQQEPAVQNEQLGSIHGHAFYSNGDDHSGIVLTPDKTDGLRAIAKNDGSRAIISMVKSNEDGWEDVLDSCVIHCKDGDVTP